MFESATEIHPPLRFPTPVRGLDAIIYERNIAYLHESGYMIVGDELFDLSTNKSVTNTLVEKALSQRIGCLDLTAAFTIGNGPIQIIELSSPCQENSRRLHHHLFQPHHAANLTRHIFFHIDPCDPRSNSYVRRILSDPDNLEMLENIYMGHMDTWPAHEIYVPSETLSQHDAACRTLGLRNLPCIYSDGNYLSGYHPAHTDRLLKKLHDARRL